MVGSRTDDDSSLAVVADDLLRTSDVDGLIVHSWIDDESVKVGSHSRGCSDRLVCAFDSKKPFFPRLETLRDNDDTRRPLLTELLVPQSIIIHNLLPTVRHSCAVGQ